VVVESVMKLAFSFRGRRASTKNAGQLLSVKPILSLGGDITRCGGQKSGERFRLLGRQIINQFITVSCCSGW
jgi:hypothetical protein